LRDYGRVMNTQRTDGQHKVSAVVKNMASDPHRASSRLVLQNRTDDLKRVNSWLDGLSICQNWPEDIIFEVKLAVYEAVANVVFYAFEDGKCHDIIIDLEEPSVGLLEITIVDDGIPFDPTQAEVSPAADSLLDASINGRGIALFKSLSDSVTYKRQDGLNHLTLQRRLA